MSFPGVWHLTAALLAALTLAAPVSAFEPAQTFARGTYVLSLEGGYAGQANIEGFTTTSDLRLLLVGLRSSIVPLGPAGPGVLRGALEVGLEPLYHRYTAPTSAYWLGLSAVLRYHLLSFGRFVPYLEVAGGPGGGDLSVPEIRSTFCFVAWGGVGASVFLRDATALYAGYRFVHNSNGNIDAPNRGWEAHTAIAGVSYYFR